MENKTLLEVRGLTKTFTHNPWLQPGTRQHKNAVVEVSFTLREGEILGIIGESGSGKTTLARLILRLEKPTQGRVFFMDRDVFKMKKNEFRKTLRPKIRLIFQHPEAALNPAYTVQKVLDKALRRYTKLTTDGRTRRSRELLQSVHLPPAEYLPKHPHEMSGGEKRRLLICRALATAPSLIIADEPLSGLDRLNQSRIVDLLRSIRDQYNVALVIISHDISNVRRICDRIGVMYRGRLVDQLNGTDQAAFEQGRHGYTRALFEAYLKMNSVNKQ